MTIFGFFGPSKTPVEPAVPASTMKNDPNESLATTDLTLKRKRYGSDALGETMAIDVGGDDGSEIIRFEAHERKIRKASTFFAHELSNIPSAEMKVVELPDEEPHVLNQVQHWLYNGCLLESAGENVTDSQKDFLSDEEEDEIVIKKKKAKRSADGDPLDDDHGEYSETADRADSNQTNANEESLGTAASGANSKVNAEDDSLTALNLTKIYILAETLGMPKLCDQVIAQLAIKLGTYHKIPYDALLYAYRRSQPHSKVRGLLVAFAVRHQELQLSIMYLQAHDPFDDVPKELLYDLLLQLSTMRDGDWEEDWDTYIQENEHSGWLWQ